MYEMISVGAKLPAFSVKATVDLNFDKAFIDITEQSYEGKWKILFFWPKDFPFVCPTEIAAFNDMVDALQTDELCPCNWKPGDDTLKP